MPDFEALEIAFPASSDEQERLIEGIQKARLGQRCAADALREEFNRFSDRIDGRGDEELPEIPEDDNSDET